MVGNCNLLILFIVKLLQWQLKGCMASQHAQLGGGVGLDRSTTTRIHPNIQNSCGKLLQVIRYCIGHYFFYELATVKCEHSYLYNNKPLDSSVFFPPKPSPFVIRNILITQKLFQKIWQKLKTANFSCTNIFY